MVGDCRKKGVVLSGHRDTFGSYLFKEVASGGDVPEKGNLAGSCQDWTLGLQGVVASTILASSSSYLLGRQCLVLPQESQISKFLAYVE